METIKQAAKVLVREFAAVDYFDIVSIDHTNILEKLETHSNIFERSGRPFFALAKNSKIATTMEILTCSQEYKGLVDFGNLNDLMNFIVMESDDLENSDRKSQREKIAEMVSKRRLRFKDILDQFDDECDDRLEGVAIALTGEFDKTTKDHLEETIERLGGFVSKGVKDSDYLLYGAFPNKKKIGVARKYEVELIDLTDFVKLLK